MNQAATLDGRLQFRERLGLHDFKRSHCDRVWNLPTGIAGPDKLVLTMIPGVLTSWYTTLKGRTTEFEGEEFPGCSRQI
jgi:hypothetical protein